MNENLVLMRNFLFKWFIIGFGLFFLSVVLYILLKDFGAEMVFKLYNVEPLYYYKAAFDLFSIIKLFLIFLVLSPALALHWMVKTKEKK